MKNFFETLKKSIWSKEHYAVMASRSPKEAFKYFFSLILVVSFLITVFFSILILPKGVGLLNKFLYMSIDKYPNDLVLNFKDGLASTTIPRVYKMDITNEFFNDKEVDYLKKSNIENFVVIDTKENFKDLKNFYEAKTFVLLTRDTVVSVGDNASININLIPKDINETVDKGRFTHLVVKIISLVKYIAPIAVVLTLVFAFMISSLIYLLVALISSLIILLIMKVYRKEGSFKEAFVTALYAVTLIIVFDTVLYLFGISSFSFGVLMTVLVFVLNTEIWKKKELPSNDVMSPPTVEPPTKV